MTLTPLKRSLILGLLAMAITSTAPAQTVATEGCFPFVLPNTSQPSPPSATLWCAISESTGATPLVSSWDTGLVHVYQGFTASTLHVQYDNWYAAMDSTFQLELITGSQDLVFQPFEINYLGDPVTLDIPLGGISVPAGSSIRLHHWARIDHTCGSFDNCGLHMTMTFQ
jgi:hypothetical protein